MFESTPRGYLRHSSGTPISPEQLARFVGCSVGEIRKALAEMEQAGTFSRLEDGTIYSRRMLRDERIRGIRKEAGRLGGNPNLVNQTVKQTTKQKPTPSSSSSSSSSDITPIPPFEQRHLSPNGGGKASWKKAKFEEFWSVVWLKKARGNAQPVFEKHAKTPELADQIIQAAKKQGPGIIRNAAKNGHTPVFPATWLNGQRWLDEDLPLIVDSGDMPDTDVYDRQWREERGL